MSNFYNQKEKMNMKIVLLLALVCVTVRTQAPSPSVSVSECLSRIIVDDKNVGEYAQAEVTVANQANTKVNPKRLLQVAQDTNSLTELIKSYFSLSSETQAAIKKCNPSITGATSRCESVHGAGNCEVRGPGLANKKCAKKLTSFGHSMCTKRCPSAFKEHGLYCYKSTGIKTPRYKTMAECKKTHKRCQRFTLSYFVPKCGRYQTRQGPDGCIPRCPLHWEDLGRKCLKPTIDVEQKVFAWEPKDN
jgi:hypothetical protein